ncbi:MAG: 30S ribosomal protein S11 [Candidatus Moraniibacteriota bacterium]|nr:MAG: 30S ribosomal protein S11 [Candidatus Moranbacteria bacterium]
MSDEKTIKEEKKPTEKVVFEEKKEASAKEVVTAQPLKRKKSGKRQIRKGQAHIQSTYNNTIVTITDLNGAVLGWSSAGSLGFKGAKKSTPYAASQIVNDVVEKIQKNNIKELQVFVKGVGGGRDAAIRALAAKGFEISLIKDITPIAHNGCTRRKPRRV